MTTVIVYMEGLASTPDMCLGARALYIWNSSEDGMGGTKVNVGTQIKYTIRIRVCTI